MSDLIDRIKGLRYIHVPQASQLFEEAIAEIERLRAHVELLEATSAASHSGFMVMAGGFENAVAEVSRLRLTEAEREAIEVACEDLRHAEEVATLRNLLNRTTL